MSTKIREAIYADQYVDLFDLLYPNIEEFMYAGSSQEESNKKDSEARRRVRRNLRSDEWNRAFQLYMSVYLERYPEWLQGLLSYNRSVQDFMLCTNMNWRHYDYKFRFERAVTKWPWHAPRVDLFMICATSGYPLYESPTTGASRADRQGTGRGNTRLPFRGQGGKDNRSKRPCFAFNGGGCSNGTNCRYQHVCSNCQGKHPAIQHLDSRERKAISAPTDSGKRKSSE